MLTKQDLQSIREVMREEIHEQVSPIVERIIDEKVPGMIQRGIESTVPGMIQRGIENTVPGMIKSEVYMLRKEMRAGFKRLNTKLERYENRNRRRSNSLLSTFETYHDEAMIRIVRLENKIGLTN